MTIKVVHRARTEYVEEGEYAHLAVFEGEDEHSSSTLAVEETWGTGRKRKATIFLSQAQWAELAKIAAKQAKREVHTHDKHMTNDEVVAMQEERRKSEPFGSKKGQQAS